MAEFIDIERAANNTYTNLMNNEVKDMEELKEKLEDIIKEDPEYLDSYNTLYNIALSEEDYLGAEIMLNRAYDKATIMLLDKQENWPEKLSWSHASNHHLIRTLLNKSIDFWMEDKFAEAKNILTFLNSSNPKEGLGFDFYLLAVSHKKNYMDFLSEYTDNGTPNEEGKAWFDRNTKASN